jgi:hypothetical protein
MLSGSASARKNHHGIAYFRLSLRHWKTFQSNCLLPLIQAGIPERTIPDKPRSSKQKYRLTAKGRARLSQQDDEKRAHPMTNSAPMPRETPQLAMAAPPVTYSHCQERLPLPNPTGFCSH